MRRMAAECCSHRIGDGSRRQVRSGHAAGRVICRTVGPGVGGGMARRFHGCPFGLFHAAAQAGSKGPGLAVAAACINSTNESLKPHPARAVRTGREVGAGREGETRAESMPKHRLRVRAPGTSVQHRLGFYTETSAPPNASSSSNCYAFSSFNGRRDPRAPARTSPTIRRFATSRFLIVSAASAAREGALLTPGTVFVASRGARAHRAVFGLASMRKGEIAPSARRGMRTTSSMREA